MDLRQILELRLSWWGCVFATRGVDLKPHPSFRGIVGLAAEFGEVTREGNRDQSIPVLYTLEARQFRISVAPWSFATALRFPVRVHPAL